MGKHTRLGCRWTREPPVQWQMMPMMSEAAPEFTRRFPEAAAIFDNLHMLHDNIDDVLSSPDLFPTHQAQRSRILELLAIYLHRNQQAGLYTEYRLPPALHPHDMGLRPPSVHEVLGMEQPRVPAEHPGHH